MTEFETIARLNAALTGRYEIERQVGEGGMALVYLAHDLRHERRVALKVLRPDLAAALGAERFLAEIKTTANLHHPHILALFDSGEADDFLYYVMPYVDGETLQERINREKQLPVEEAIRIAKAVANALQVAHDQGIVHRDIKPGNILLSGGEPLVSDFGIALAVGESGGGRLTQTGFSLGTPYYMSPEQASGDQAVGPASDIYALGCVLYEMLVGEPPYSGASTQVILGKIMRGPPVSPTEIRRSIPAHADAAVRKALERIPADRFTGARRFAQALADPAFRYDDPEAKGAGGFGASWNLPAIGASAVALALLGFLGGLLTRSPPALQMPVERFESPFRSGQEPVEFGTDAFALSPDGTMLVYRGPSAQSSARLWVRRWSELEAAPVRGTEGAVTPSFSPDGSQVAFEQGDEIRAVSIDGGNVRILMPGYRPYWAPDGYIYAGSSNGIDRIPEEGGTVENVVEGPGGPSQYWPADIFPDGEGMLITIGAGARIGWVDFDRREVTSLGEGALPSLTSAGHVVYLSEGGLAASAFDPARPATLGSPAYRAEGVTAFSLARDGKMFYANAPEAGTSEFVWLNREGLATPVDPGSSFDSGGGGNIGWSLSPDDSRVAVRRVTETNSDIWIKDLPDGPFSRLTVHEADELGPRWTPDGESVSFLSEREVDLEVWTRRADGTGEAERVFRHEGRIAKAIWSPDGEWLVIRQSGLAGGAEGERDILGYQLAGDGGLVPLVATPEYAEQAPALSADGNWLAYTSDETGSNQVVVRPFPNVDDAKVQVSVSGGIVPVWAHSGRELFFIDEGPRMMVAHIRTDPTFEVESIEPLFDIPAGYPVPQNGAPYDVTSDDQRFLMARVFSSGEENVQRMVLVTNFLEELRLGGLPD